MGPCGSKERVAERQIPIGNVGPTLWNRGCALFLLSLEPSHTLAFSSFPCILTMPKYPDLSGYIINNGRLELKQSLGSGSYGQVYNAIDLETEPSLYYAVKCLQRGGDNSRRHIKQTRERRLHATISSHPNVVTFHKAVYEDFYVFFVLEL